MSAQHILHILRSISPVFCFLLCTEGGGSLEVKSVRYWNRDLFSETDENILKYNAYPMEK